MLCISYMLKPNFNSHYFDPHSNLHSGLEGSRFTRVHIFYSRINLMIKTVDYHIKKNIIITRGYLQLLVLRLHSVV